jgi:hypothetical protein
MELDTHVLAGETSLDRDGIQAVSEELRHRGLV